jgi:hypothetical protein
MPYVLHAIAAHIRCQKNDGSSSERDDPNGEKAVHKLEQRTLRN